MIRTDIVNIGDPFVLTVDGGYVMYATTFGHNGFYAYTSTDLVEWKGAGVVCDLSDSWAENDFWAPEVIRRKDGKYLIHFSARRATDHSLRIGVAVADSPLGPFVQPKNAPMFDFGYAAIDGHVFVDDDGSAYLYYSRDCSENIVGGGHVSQLYAVRLNDELTEVISEPTLVTTPHLPFEHDGDGSWLWNEGPAMLKRDGKYFLFYSANFYASKMYCTCVAVADSPLGEFQKPAYNPLLSYTMAEDFSGPGHNAFFVDHDGKLKTSFHIHTDPAHPSGDRRAVIADVAYRDGRFFIEI